MQIYQSNGTSNITFVYFNTLVRFVQQLNRFAKRAIERAARSVFILQPIESKKGIRTIEIERPFIRGYLLSLRSDRNGGQDDYVQIGRRASCQLIS